MGFAVIAVDARAIDIRRRVRKVIVNSNYHDDHCMAWAIS